MCNNITCEIFIYYLDKKLCSDMCECNSMPLGAAWAYYGLSKSPHTR